MFYAFMENGSFENNLFQGKEVEEYQWIHLYVHFEVLNLCNVHCSENYLKYLFPSMKFSTAGNIETSTIRQSIIPYQQTRDLEVSQFANSATVSILNFRPIKHYRLHSRGPKVVRADCEIAIHWT